LVLEPLLDSAYGNRGSIYARLGNDEAAISNFQVAAELS
jgi:regulator of sirC expression with transglutaminase-like and TPR domain